MRRVRCWRGMLRRPRARCPVLVMETFRRHSTVMRLWGEPLGVLTGISPTRDVRTGLIRPSWMPPEEQHGHPE